MSSNIYGMIYLIINKVNNKIYVGQTKGDFKGRYRGDVEKNTHSEHLKRAFNKYGIDNFLIVEQYDIAYNEEQLNELEKFYIGLFDSMNREKGYNKTEGGSNGKKSEETIKKMSASKKGVVFSKEHRENLSKARVGKYTGENHYFYGKHHTEESKKKISIAMKGKYIGEKHPMYNKHHTEESKKKISKAMSGANNPNYNKTGASHHSSIKIVMLDRITGEFIRVWDNARDVDRYFNKVTNTNISACCKGKVKTAYGYKWAYYEEYVKEHPEAV